MHGFPPSLSLKDTAGRQYERSEHSSFGDYINTFSTLTLPTSILHKPYKWLKIKIECLDVFSLFSQNLTG
jgi:hypothetical protein